MLNKSKTSVRVYVPCAVSSFFEICDLEKDGSKIQDELRIGARGGGFIIRRGNITRATISPKPADEVIINGKPLKTARTTLKVIELMRREYRVPPLRIFHRVEPPIGSGFGTSGAGALGAAIAVSTLLGLQLTLTEASAYAHKAEIESVTGLGTVISLASGSGAIGLVTEPGSFSVGRVDSLLRNYDAFLLVSACFGAIEKSTVLQDKHARAQVNRFGNATLLKVLKDRTPESLLSNSRVFAEMTGLASSHLLRLADQAVKIGAIGATQNMIGNAIHCLVLKSERKRFLSSFSKIVPNLCIFESELSQSGPRII